VKQRVPTRRRSQSAGVTLMELLIAITLLSLLSAGIVISLRVALSAMNKADSRLTSNRRVTSVQRILKAEISGLIPVSAECRPPGDAPRVRIAFFEGEQESMRLASSYSLQQGARGLPMILEFQVIPAENNQGVRLVVNEQWYTGPEQAGLTCLGVGPDPITGVTSARFRPIAVGANSFVLADKLAYCRFSYREVLPASPQAHWLDHWVRPVLLPDTIRIEMAPLAPDPGHLQPVSLTIPVHVNKHPLEPYENN
jgi:general secretion pathway protein J